jgi:hypothetical protein
MRTTRDKGQAFAQIKGSEIEFNRDGIDTGQLKN